MNRPTPIALIVAIAMLAGIPQVSAQTLTPIKAPAPSGSHTPARDQNPIQIETLKPVKISASYTLQIAYDPNNAEAAARSLEIGRKSLYRILGSECDLLLTTIAETCRVISAKVRINPTTSNSRRRRYRRTRRPVVTKDKSLPTLRLNASVQLEITLKPAR